MKHCLMFAFCLLILVGCKSSKNFLEESSCLSSKLSVTVPLNGELMSAGGSMKIVRNERMQLSVLMPILRSEIFRLEVTPEEVLVVDRMGKRFLRTGRAELQNYLGEREARQLKFSNLEKLLWKAAQGKRSTLTAEDLGFLALKGAKVELYDFATTPFTLFPTEVSAKYKQVTIDELIKLLDKQ